MSEMVKCSMIGCQDSPNRLVYWPGREPQAMCKFHSDAALTVAAAMSFHLVVEPMKGVISDVNDVGKKALTWMEGFMAGRESGNQGADYAQGWRDGAKEAFDYLNIRKDERFMLLMRNHAPKFPHEGLKGNVNET